MKLQESNCSDELWLRVEDFIQNQSLCDAKKTSVLDPSALEVQKLLNQLQLRQNELEKQNELLKESRAKAEAEVVRYAELYDLAPAGYLTLDRDATILKSNLAAANLIGYDRISLIGKSFKKFLSEEDSTTFSIFLHQSFEGQSVLTYEVELLANKPSSLHVQMEVLRSPCGTECRIVIVDISERKQIENSLRAREEWLTMLTSNASIMDILSTIVRGVEREHPGTLCSVLLLDTDGTHLFCGAAPSLPNFYNQAIDGLTIGPCMGSCGTAAFTGERVVVTDIQNDPLWADFKELAARAGLSACWSEPIRGSQGRLLGTFAIYHTKVRVPDDSEIRTITAAAQLSAAAIERRLVEQALSSSEARFRAFMEKMPVAAFIKDEAGCMRYVNPTYELLFQTSLHKIRGKNDFELWPAEIAHKLRENDLAIFASSQQTEIFEVIPTPDGVQRHWFVVKFIFTNSEGHRFLGGTAIDLTAHHKAEQELRTSAQLLEASQSIAKMGGWELDLITKKLFWTAETYRLHDTSPEEFNPTVDAGLECYLPESRRILQNALNAAIESGVGYDLELETLTTKGRKIRVRTTCIVTLQEGRPIKLTGIFQDITEQKRAEEERDRLQTQLTQAQKMESIGRLAGGVAHDFNNMLQAIQGNVSLAMIDLLPGSRFYENFEEIQKCTQRAADLTRQLLAFARKQTVAPVILDLNFIVEGMLNLLRRLIGEDIDLIWIPDKSPTPIKIDPSQIDQILANLCVNARDAISGVGQVMLQTRNIVIDEKISAKKNGFIPGEYILLTVSDTGCGMDNDIMDHLFEPFFTTKATGHGTGLGLATVFGIVTQNRGFIDVQSKQGYGTVFEIYLPREASSVTKIKETKSSSMLCGGQGTILVVEDELSILRFAKSTLEKLGYTVLAAATPVEALEISSKYSGNIELLMTDVVMPGMNGRDLAKQLILRFPAIKCVFMSGYTADVIARNGILEHGIHFLQKPFSLEIFADKVREVLGLNQDLVL